MGGNSQGFEIQSIELYKINSNLGANVEGIASHYALLATGQKHCHKNAIINDETTGRHNVKSTKVSGNIPSMSGVLKLF